MTREQLLDALIEWALTRPDPVVALGELVGEAMATAARNEAAAGEVTP